MAYKIGLQEFITLIVIIHLSVAQAILKGPGYACCQTLSSRLPRKVFMRGDAKYSESLRTYYAGQEGGLRPSCIVKPEFALDVSIALKSLSTFDGYKCHFAIRGGGHTPFAGSANIAREVTIDLGAMNNVTVSDDNTTTSVGGGARWVDVYQKLDALNLAVSGGRSNLVGVGGLITGGVLQLLPPGDTQSNVTEAAYRSFHLAKDGTILNVNRQNHSDLMKALRGGSNNFGIVTQFDLHTFPQGKLWGGDIVYHESVTPQVLSAFTKFGAQEHYDKYATLFIAHSYQSISGQFLALATPIYTQPVVNPSVFASLTILQPQLFNSLRVDVLGSYTNVTASAVAAGQRNAFITVTFKNDLSFLNETVALWKTNAASIAKVSGLTYTMLNQHLLPIVIRRTTGLGGNSLGLDDADGPLVLSLLSITWANAAEDDAVMAAAKSLIEQIENAAKDRGVYHAYKYLNYANAGQAVFDGYGQASKAYLQAMSRRYDPHGFFQTRVPGGFKLFSKSNVEVV